MVRIIKVGAIGELGGIRKSLQNVDSFTLSTIEHGALYWALETMMPNNSSLPRKLGMFVSIAVAYDLLVTRLQSAETSGTGR